jgi:hypothetical protein
MTGAEAGLVSGLVAGVVGLIEVVKVLVTRIQNNRNGGSAKLSREDLLMLHAVKGTAERCEQAMKELNETMLLVKESQIKTCLCLGRIEEKLRKN